MAAYRKARSGKVRVYPDGTVERLYRLAPDGRRAWLVVDAYSLGRLPTAQPRKCAPEDVAGLLRTGI